MMPILDVHGIALGDWPFRSWDAAFWDHVGIRVEYAEPYILDRSPPIDAWRHAAQTCTDPLFNQPLRHVALCRWGNA